MTHMTQNRPYKDLYVYLLNGRLGPCDEEGLGGGFLGNWVEGGNSFLFFSRPSTDLVAGVLERRPDIELIEDHHFSYEEWQGGGLGTVRIANFLIVPPWFENEACEGVIKILLDPGVVFGNGLHPTTRDCLKAISMVAEKGQMGRVLDLGTGTGILAIAAAFSGARQVLAVDLNPLCVKTAQENVRRNHLEDKVEVVEGSVEDIVDEPADLFLANIHSPVIKGLFQERSFGERGRAVLSGLMRSQYRGLLPELRKHRFRVLREWDHEMTWYTVLAEKGSVMRI